VNPFLLLGPNLKLRLVLWPCPLLLHAPCFLFQCTYVNIFLAISLYAYGLYTPLWPWLNIAIAFLEWHKAGLCYSRVMTWNRCVSMCSSYWFFNFMQVEQMCAVVLILLVLQFDAIDNWFEFCETTPARPSETDLVHRLVIHVARSVSRVSAIHVDFRSLLHQR
jgi:hypothetical protein